MQSKQGCMVLFLIQASNLPVGWDLPAVLFFLTSRAWLFKEARFLQVPLTTLELCMSRSQEVKFLALSSKQKKPLKDILSVNFVAQYSPSNWMFKESKESRKCPGVEGRASSSMCQSHLCCSFSSLLHICVSLCSSSQALTHSLTVFYKIWILPGLWKVTIITHSL